MPVGFRSDRAMLEKYSPRVPSIEDEVPDWLSPAKPEDNDWLSPAKPEDND